MTMLYGTRFQSRTNEEQRVLEPAQRRQDRVVDRAAPLRFLSP